MRRSGYRSYLLTILMLIMAFNYVDRVALGVVLQDIKIDLSLSDTQLGFLTGIAFALFYAVMGIPIARWADRGNRVTIVTLIVAVWSIGVALCGVATSFTQLLAMRIAVAVGEGGGYPAGLSLISDHFTRAELPKATARYMLGWPLALTIGCFVAGWLNQLYGWRATFIILGAPGLLLAALTRLTIKEPRQAVVVKPGCKPVSHATVPTGSGEQAGLKEVLTTLWGNTAYRHLLFGFAVWGFLGYGSFQWQPAFFVRSHGLQTGGLGTWFAIFYGGGSLAGTLLGAALFARYTANNEGLQLRVIAALFVLSAAFTGVAYLVPRYEVAFGLLGVASLAQGALNGPIFAASQTLVPARMRAMSIALILLFSNLIGMGLGPLAVGLCSDILRPALGGESLRYTLLACCPGYLWCSWHLWQASRTANRVAAENAAADLEPYEEQRRRVAGLSVSVQVK